MTRATRDRTTIAHTPLPEFFHDLVARTARRQRLQLKQETTHYLVNLLHAFARAEELFKRDSETLASLFLESTQDIPHQQRLQLLKRVGDVALYVSGFFSDSLNHKLVDVDYYISMGGSAYASLESLVRGSLSASLYGELAAKFYYLVDLLSHISEEKALTSNEDILRLYERWLRTGSQRLYKKLVHHGILPANQSTSNDH